MRRSVLIAAIAVMALCMPASLVFESDDSDAATVTYRITGYVNEEFSSGNIGLANVNVELYEYDFIQEKMNSVGSGTTSSDDKGRFTIDMDSIPTNCYIAFSLNKYGLRSLSKYASETETEKVDDNGLTAYRLSLPTPTTTTDESGKIIHTYLITSEKADGLSCFTMATTTGEIIISVTYEGSGVIGAKVELTGYKTFYGKTNSTGIFKMDGLTIGEYDLTVSADGFEPEKTTVKIVKGSSSEQVKLTKKDAATYLGMDLSHFLMFAGIILGLSVAFSAKILHKRSGKSDREAT